MSYYMEFFMKKKLVKWLNEWKSYLLGINVSCYSIWDEIICTAEFEQFEERVAFSPLFIILKNFTKKSSKTLRET